MKIVLGVVASILIGVVTLAAMAPWGAPDSARFVMPLLPYMAAHVFLARGVGVVPSPVLFAAGLVMDIATDGPIGFWAVIYLAAALVARQIPGEMMQGVSGRLAALAGMVVVLFVLQVAIASLYRFEWVDWQGVIWGTGMAALGVLVVDLFWRGGGGERRLNVTERGARQAGRIG